MRYQEKDSEYNYYRELYIEAISKQQFPWEPAYYYYMQNIDRIDVMSLEDFQEEMLTLSSVYDSTDAAFDNISAPIYETLDQYFNIAVLIKNDKAVKLV